MGRGSIIAGLDIGTTKVCATVGQLIDGKINAIAYGISPSRGLRKGIVVDIETTVNSIIDAVKEAEKAAGVEINSVYVGMAGGHIMSFESYGTIAIRGKEVTRIDISKAIEAAETVHVPLDREILHVFPTEFVVDGQGEIMNPIGMTGVRLEARVQIVTGSLSAVQNLIRCCEKARLQVVDIVLGPLASALATLTDDEKREGVVLIDIGGGTTDITFYKDGVLSYTSVIAIGGNHITNDITIGLRLPVQEAERVKNAYGQALSDQKTENEEIKIMVAGRDEKTIPRSYLTEIINPRCIELIDVVKDKLKTSKAYNETPYGVVLTGGASQLAYFDRMVESILGLPVRIGFPKNIDGGNIIVSDPKYAVGVGLLLYGAENEKSPTTYRENISEKMKDWIRGFLDFGKGFLRR